MSTTPIHTFEVADPPFDDTDADIVLRSSDDVDFYVHKWPLSRASSVFEDMFSIPSPNAPSNADDLKDGLPVVRVAEDYQTLDIVLRLCYPRDQQTLTLDVPSIRQLLPALEKYEMLKDMTEILEPMMLAAAETDSRAMYAIACRYQMLKLANRIAVLSRRLLSDASSPSTIGFFTPLPLPELFIPAGLFLKCSLDPSEVKTHPVAVLRWISRLKKVHFTAQSGS
ncbi:hypothetical protein HETIRDRAFT_101564 [Heterobasidion irregulare TC 32-1]|uniref:BTB domain-containing protein n=1 Tax=Heterobasidion irregulare (strain TC 32-1) TaxID=747525 RepID=W4K5T9_HETIT|nr:uncharacterized protein HETIRDRAFT_101564 [Heterobasidion irregulare TC 32-1]ETW80406.1 hypothetical protein HETIRDRAFT_101564 [Heterobasidion irregulare TC 32-1]